MSSEANKQTIKRQRAGWCPRSLPRRERLGLHPRESQGYEVGSFVEFPADTQVPLAVVSSMAFRGCGLTTPSPTGLNSLIETTVTRMNHTDTAWQTWN